jgi:hypothetical protein
MINIPRKDVELIKDVADYVARTNPVPTYTVDDLAQEMFIYGMQSYSKWDESQHAHKGSSKRDKNLRIFLKNFMNLRVKNMYRANTKNKRAVNVNVISFDQNDPVYESLLLDEESNDLTADSFEGLGLSEDEIKVLLYIGDNGLGKGGKSGPSKREAAVDLGIDTSRLNEIIKDLGNNPALRDFFQERLELA